MFGQKRCKHCGEEKDLTAFQGDPSAAGGRRSTCKMCRNDLELASRLKKKPLPLEVAFWTAYVVKHYGGTYGSDPSILLGQDNDEAESGERSTLSRGEDLPDESSQRDRLRIRYGDRCQVHAKGYTMRGRKY